MAANSVKLIGPVKRPIRRESEIYRTFPFFFIQLLFFSSRSHLWHMRRWVAMTWVQVTSKQDPVFVTGWKKIQKTIKITWTWTLVRSHLEPGLRGPREPCVLWKSCLVTTHLPPKSGLKRMSYPFSNLSTVVLATDIPLLPVEEL